MSLYQVFEWLVVLGALLFSLVLLLRKLAPRWARALHLSRAPSGPDAGAACDDGCSTCGKCGPSQSDAPGVIVIHRPAKD